MGDQKKPDMPADIVQAVESWVSPEPGVAVGPLLKKLAAAARHDTSAQEDLKKAVLQQTRIRKVVAALKRARTTRGITIEQVAEASGVHKSVISRFENESADPHLGTLLRYADAVGADLAVLIDGDRVSDFGMDTSLLDGIPMAGQHIDPAILAAIPMRLQLSTRRSGEDSANPTETQTPAGGDQDT